MDVLRRGLPTATNTLEAMEVLHSAVKVLGNVCFGLYIIYNMKPQKKTLCKEHLSQGHLGVPPTN